jgi:integrase
MTIRKRYSKRWKTDAWYLVIYRKALRVKGFFRTKAEAEEAELHYLNQIRKKQFNPDLHKPVPLKKLVAAHLDYINNRPKVARVERILTDFRQMMENLLGKNIAVHELKKADLWAYAKKRLKDGVSNQTINREMTEIKACLNAGSMHFRDLDDYSCPKVPRLPEPIGGSKPQWDDKEAEAILKALVAPPQKHEARMVYNQRLKLADMFVTCLLTGLRAGEARHLHRSQIDFSKNEMEITSTKGKGARPRTRTVPFNDVVFEILKRRANEGEWIFSNPTNDQPMSDPYRLFKTACERAGVAYGMAVKKIINGCRHTFATKALKEYGHDAATVAKLLGHSVETMVRSYLHTRDEELHAVVRSRSGENLGGIVGRQVEETDPSEATADEGEGPKPDSTQVITVDSIN